MKPIGRITGSLDTMIRKENDNMNGFVKISKSFIKNNIWIILIIGIGIFFRARSLVSNWTSYDDIGVAVTMLFYDDLKGLERFKSVKSATWTYAPLQLIFPAFILNNGMSYEEIIFWGRFPSFIFGVLAIFLQFVLAKKEENQKSYIPCLTALMLAISWENIIYSTQMEPYEIGVFFVALITILLYKEKNSWVDLVVLVLACYAQYQLYIFVFSYYVINLWISRKNKKNFFLYFTQGVINLLLCIPLLNYVFTKGMLSRGTNWNVGPDNMFLFSIPDGTLISKIKYIFVFFMRNTIIIVKSFYVSNSSTCWAYIIACIVFLFVVIGFVKLHKSENKKIFYYICLNGTIFLALILMGKLALSPTRHSLVGVPLYLLMFGKGVTILDDIKQDIIKKIISYALPICFCTIFACQYNQEYTERLNHCSSETYQSIIDNYEPSYLASYGYKFEINLLNFDGYDRVSDWILSRNCYFHKSGDEIDEDSYVVAVGAGRINEEEFFEYFWEKVESVEGNSKRDLYNVELIYEEEIKASTSVEYATDFFAKSGNGYYMYVYKFVK